MKPTSWQSFIAVEQKLKESEEAFADELQILACKVIIKKPDFRNNLDTTLKQRYASQLFDCNSASIAKTLLVQMQKCSFTEFRNELARVLGTRQHAISKASAKPITTKSVEVEEEEEEDVPLPPKPLKSHAKKDKKISMQSSQIKDLRSKLDQAVAENSQIRELLSPATLTTAFSNALTATKTTFTNKSSDIEVIISSLVKAGHFWGSTILLNCQQERMVSLTPIKPAITVRIWDTY